MNRSGFANPDAVRGLQVGWRQLTRRAPTERRVPLRPLLDTLGLGLEQTVTRLGRHALDGDNITAWIVDVSQPGASGLPRDCVAD